MSDTTQSQTRSEPAVLQKNSSAGKLLKKCIAAVDSVIPGTENFTLSAVRGAKMRVRKALWSMRSADKSKEAGSLVLTVNPAAIEHCSNTEYSFGYFKGAVLSGDWDQSTKRFEDLDVYRAFEAVCKNKSANWSDTDFYQRSVKSIESGEVLWQCATREEFDARCKKLTELYQTIERDGYTSDKGRTGETEFPDEVSVAVGRTGELLFSDGAHRLSVAKLLGVNEIPVTVTVRHSEWDKFRGELFELARIQASGLLYQPCTHPDLLDIPATHSCEDRFNAIKSHLPTKSGKLLDIGSNMSYMPHRFEAEGFDCIAAENAEIHLYFIRKLKAASQKKFEIRAGSVLEDEELLKQDFDAVLALNIFHHFLKTEELYDQLTNFLDKLKTKSIFLETHRPDERQMQTAYKNLSPDEFCQLLVDRCGLNGFELIYTAEDGRPLYVLK